MNIFEGLGNWGAEGWSAFFTAVTSVGVVVAAWQLRLQKGAWKSEKEYWDFEREKARKEQEREEQAAAMEVLRVFIMADNWRWAAARKLVERFDQDMVEKLERGDELEVPADLTILLSAALADPTIPNQRTRLNTKQVFELRYLILTFLNHAELVFHSLDAFIAPSAKGIIEEQMKPYYMPDEKKTLIENYRKAADGKISWPHLTAFVGRHSCSCSCKCGHAI